MKIATSDEFMRQSGFTTAQIDLLHILRAARVEMRAAYEEAVQAADDVRAADAKRRIEMARVAIIRVRPGHV